MKKVTRLMSVLAPLTLLVAGVVYADKMDAHNTSMFQGPKANTGMAIHSTENGKSILRVSKEFKVPTPPRPLGA